MAIARQCSIHEFFMYSTGCVVFIACLSQIIRDDNNDQFLAWASIVGSIVLSGPVIAGPIGFAVHGREGFRIASYAVIAISILLLALFLIIPAPINETS